MADVDLVISSAVDFRQNEAAASFKISLVFTKRAAFQARYKTLLATATKALEGLAVLHFAEIQNSTVARTTEEAVDFKTSTSQVAALNANIARTVQAAMAQEVAAVPHEQWEGYVMCVCIAPKTQNYVDNYSYAEDPQGWRKYGLPKKSEQFSTELQYKIKQRCEDEDVAVVPADRGLGALRSMIFVKTASPSAQGWQRLNTWLTEHHLHDYSYWFSHILKLEGSGTPEARVVSKREGVRSDWPLISNVCIRKHLLDAFQHDAPENKRLKLRRALLAALAKQQILSVSDGGEQALVAYDPQTALGEMVFTGLASEVQYLQQCISDLEACNQRSRRELSGNRAMEEALVPFDRNREETTTARALVLDVQVLRQRLDELDRVNRRLCSC